MSAIVLTAVERELKRREWQERWAQRSTTVLSADAATLIAEARAEREAELYGPGIAVTDYVIDASAAVEYLLKTPVGLAMADTIESGSLVAPELIDAEVLSTLRREVLGRRAGRGTGAGGYR